MGKRYGDPYDPKIRESEHGSRLYQTWKRLRKHQHSEEWDSFLPFYIWATKSGYVIGARLRLRNDLNPYAPDNCVWDIPEDPQIPQSWADEWNKSVNRIRKHYGMPPLEGTSYDDL